MCSIAGGKSKKEVQLMLDLMAHRSPDDIGGIEYPDFALGMGRLAIVDKKEVPSPLSDGHAAIAFNGEIYNYLELKKQLKGYKFKTKTDTEVLLAAWQKWGVKMFDKLNGMFAMAIVCDNGKQIMLARDIAGEKPLYFTEHPFRFASEAKALDFKCREFPPAHYGIYKNGTLTIKPYWKLEQREIKLKTADEELEALLEDAVKIRTKADVPYGLFYSGGIDSALIASFHKFDKKFRYKDGPYGEEFMKIFPKILWHLDYPVQSFSPFGLWKLSETAQKNGVKVILSGEGADELFGGYARYVKPHFEHEALKQFPSYPDMFPNPESVTMAGLREFSGNMRELLRMGDRMTSAFGIENRCPFLDKRIIQFAFSLPDEMKIQGTETKVILRKILKRREPKYKFGEKHGLFCSVNEWMGVPNPRDKTIYMMQQQMLWKKFQS